MIHINRSTEAGPLTELTLKTLQKGTWINLVSPTPYELKVVGDFTGVPADFLRAALDDEERSHIDVEDEAILILVNAPVQRNAESYDTLPLGIIVTSQHIITVSLEDTPVLSEFNDNTSRFFRTFKKTRFLFQILYKSATFYLRYLRQISRSSDEIERLLREAMRNDDILRLLELQKGLTYFGVSLRADGAVLDKLLRLRSNPATAPFLEVHEEDEDLLEDVIIENKQAREMTEMYSQIMSRTADTFANIINNNQNLIMKFLAAMTIVLAIPAVVSGFFGMNVPLPLAAEGYAFGIIAAITACVCGTIAYVLWRHNMF